MRVLRAMFNFASSRYKNEASQTLFPENPVTELFKTRAWYKIKRKQGRIADSRLPDWFDGILKVGSESIRDYLLLVLFIGLRREEAAELSWQHVDLDELTLTIPDPKNSEPHVLPLSDFLASLLWRRYAAKVNDFVFPSKTSRSGHLVNPWKAIHRVTNDTGIKFSVHDLRRTFITTAESLDISVPHSCSRSERAG